MYQILVKIGQIFDLSRKIILVCISVAVLGFAAYYQLVREKERQYDKKAEMLVKNISELEPNERDGNNQKYIAQIFEAVVSLAADEYVKITTNNREQRREFLGKNNDKYVDLVIKYYNKVEEITCKAQKTILEKIGKHSDYLEQAICGENDKNNEQKTQFVRNFILQEIKKKISREGTRKEITQFLMKQISNIQIEKIDSTTETLESDFKMIKHAENPMLISYITQICTLDQIFSWFEIEEEDLINFLFNHNSNHGEQNWNLLQKLIMSYKMFE